MRVLLHPAVAGTHGNRLRAAAPGVELVTAEAEAWPADLGEIEVAHFGHPYFRANLRTTPLPALVELPGLRWLHSCQMGVDHPLYRRVIARGATLTYSGGVGAWPVAQYVIAMMLRIIKQLGELDRAQREHRWAPRRTNELTDKVVGIVGLGAVGLEVARLAKAFRMRVLGCRRSDEKPADVDELLPPQRLHELLARADFVVIAASKNPSTERLIDAAAIAAIRPSAWLINVARGGIVDEAALLPALTSNRIGGACLDVFETEPLPSEHPLWEAPNVILTPHNAPGGSPMMVARANDLFAENFERWATGRSLSFVSAE